MATPFSEFLQSVFLVRVHVVFVHTYSCGFALASLQWKGELPWPHPQQCPHQPSPQKARCTPTSALLVCEGAGKGDAGGEPFAAREGARETGSKPEVAAVQRSLAALSALRSSPWPRGMRLRGLPDLLHVTVAQFDGPRGRLWLRAGARGHAASGSPQRG